MVGHPQRGHHPAAPKIQTGKKQENPTPGHAAAIYKYKCDHDIAHAEKRIINRQEQKSQKPLVLGADVFTSALTNYKNMLLAYTQRLRPIN